MRWILGVVLVGDDRLPDKLRRENLVALGSRLRTRLTLQPSTPDELAECLTHRAYSGHRDHPDPSS